MNLGEILVTLYKVGTQIRVGLDLFDRIVVPAKEALDLVTKDVWEDHPTKAAFVALPDEEKAQATEPHGCGLLTNCTEFSHGQIAALVTPAKEAPPAPPAPPAAPAAQKVKAPAKAKKPATTKAAPKPKPGEKQEEETKQEDAPKIEDGEDTGTEGEGNDGDSSKD